MPSKLYLFESRNIDYLQPLVDKAKSIGFKVFVANNSHLSGNKYFKDFKDHYKHYSYNPEAFEVGCFSRYYAIAPLLDNNDSFIITDTDVFISDLFKNLHSYDFKNTFIGSEGFKSFGSEDQISPHFTVWNKDMLFDFIEFTTGLYRRNRESEFLDKYYQDQKNKLGNTAVSDMNLLYLWVKDHSIPYLNSNTTKFEFGIDHNISELLCENGKFKSHANRKYLKINNKEFSYFLESGEEQKMALLHFQGGYKRILRDFYLGKYTKFQLFSLYINYGRMLKRALGK